MRHDVNQESTHVLNLWPNSRITAGVLVLNGGKRGELGETIEFSTPEGGAFYSENFGRLLSSRMGEEREGRGGVGRRGEGWGGGGGVG